MNCRNTQGLNNALLQDEQDTEEIKEEKISGI